MATYPGQHLFAHTITSAASNPVHQSVISTARQNLIGTAILQPPLENSIQNPVHFVPSGSSVVGTTDLWYVRRHETKVILSSKRKIMNLRRICFFFLGMLRHPQGPPLSSPSFMRVPCVFMTMLIPRRYGISSKIFRCFLGAVLFLIIIIIIIERTDT